MIFGFHVHPPHTHLPLVDQTQQLRQHCLAERPKAHHFVAAYWGSNPLRLHLLHWESALVEKLQESTQSLTKTTNTRKAQQDAMQDHPYIWLMTYSKTNTISQLPRKELFLWRFPPSSAYPSLQNNLQVFLGTTYQSFLGSILGIRQGNWSGFLSKPFHTSVLPLELLSKAPHLTRRLKRHLRLLPASKKMASSNGSVSCPKLSETSKKRIDILDGFPACPYACRSYFEEEKGSNPKPPPQIQFFSRPTWHLLQRK